MSDIGMPPIHWYCLLKGGSIVEIITERVKERVPSGAGFNMRAWTCPVYIQCRAGATNADLT